MKDPAKAYYWSLAQALTWLVFRNESSLKFISEFNIVTDNHLIIMSQNPEEASTYNITNAYDTLIYHLHSGEVVAKGRKDKGIRETIDAELWVDMKIGLDSDYESIAYTETKQIRSYKIMFTELRFIKEDIERIAKRKNQHKEPLIRAKDTAELIQKVKEYYDQKVQSNNRTSIKDDWVAFKKFHSSMTKRKAEELRNNYAPEKFKKPGRK